MSKSNILGNLQTITALHNDLNSSNFKTEENFNLHHQLLMKIEDNLNPKYPKMSKRYAIKE